MSPSYAQAKSVYNLIKKLLPQEFYKEYKADLRLEILNPDGSVRSTIEFKSGDNPDTLRGFGVNFVIMDEAARQPYESFVSIMTTLTQTMGRGMFISTPKGRGWFYEVFQRGEALREEFPEWFSIRLPSWLNPHVQEQAILQLKKNMPDDVFRQEVAANFLLESAGVFRGIKNCVKPGTAEEPIAGHRYVMGVDLARIHDYTVITVIDTARNHVVAFERFNKIDWNLQYQRIISIAKQYNATVWIDSTGIGDPIVQTLQGGGIRLEPYKIGGSASKQQLIEKLRVNIEKQRISFPNIPIMINELQNYEYQLNDSGVIKYEAPQGFFDDCVISLALANWGSDRQPWVYKSKSVRGI